MNRLIQIITSDTLKLIAWFIISIILISLSENPQNYISLN